MLRFEKPDYKVVEYDETNFYGKFVLEPLERGFGTTIGNALRRVMLSSLPGSAIKSVKIDGVLHEFSTVQGVKEDVTELILNIKCLALTMEGEGPQTIYIDAKGPGVVTGADIKTDGSVEVINKDLHIATLDENGRLYMELTVNRGRGYVTQNKNKSDALPLSAIAIDSIYTPVKRVNFTVDNTRVGQITDYDKLTLEIWTNGTIKIDEAISLSAKILIEHFKLFMSLGVATNDVEIMIEKEEEGTIKILKQLIPEHFHCALKRVGPKGVQVFKHWFSIFHFELFQREITDNLI